MKATKIISALVVIFALAFISTMESCSNSPESESGAGKENLLSSEAWVLKSATMDMGLPTGPMDMYSVMDESDKDDLLSFNADHSVSRDAGLQVYAASMSQIEQKGSWAFDKEDSKLLITENNEVMEMALVSLTANELVLETTEYDAMLEKNTTMIFSYSH